MVYIAENLRRYRKEKDFTQEDIAGLLCVSPQTVSKWERGESLPDLTYLPGLADIFEISTDALIGMDRLRDAETLNSVFVREHELADSGKLDEAALILREALKFYPGHGSLMSELGMILAFSDDEAELREAVLLLERVLAVSVNEKVRGTTRTALCFVYLKVGEREKAVALAGTLPHMRESREVILPLVSGELSFAEIDENLRMVFLGDKTGDCKR